MAEKTYKALGPAREAFDKAVKAAAFEFEKAGGAKVEVITLKRHDGQIQEVRINQ